MLNNSTFVVLMADDDDDDRLLAYEALIESDAGYEIRFVKDGIELMQYLYREGDYNNRSEEHTSELQSRPHLVCRLLLEKKNDRYDLRLIVRLASGIYSFFFFCYAAHRDLHSFPTRRSSDLGR